MNNPMRCAIHGGGFIDLIRDAECFICEKNALSDGLEKLIRNARLDALEEAERICREQAGQDLPGSGWFEGPRICADRIARLRAKESGR